MVKCAVNNQSVALPASLSPMNGTSSKPLGIFGKLKIRLNCGVQFIKHGCLHVIVPCYSTVLSLFHLFPVWNPITCFCSGVVSQYFFFEIRKYFVWIPHGKGIHFCNVIAFSILQELLLAAGKNTLPTQAVLKWSMSSLLNSRLSLQMALYSMWQMIAILIS